MSDEYNSIYELKLIYIISIDDNQHKGLLKIGDTTIKDQPIDKLFPNSKPLNDAAKKKS